MHNSVITLILLLRVLLIVSMNLSHDTKNLALQPKVFRGLMFVVMILMIDVAKTKTLIGCTVLFCKCDLCLFSAAKNPVFVMVFVRSQNRGLINMLLKDLSFIFYSHVSIFAWVVSVYWS